MGPAVPRDAGKQTARRLPGAPFFVQIRTARASYRRLPRNARQAALEDD